jgi:hypothetical protein
VAVTVDAVTVAVTVNRPSSNRVWDPKGVTAKASWRSQSTIDGARDGLDAVATYVSFLGSADIIADRR